MRRAFALLLGAIAALSFAPPVQATGNCGEGYVWVFDGTQQTGASRVYCYGVNDNDIESEPGNVMGPSSVGNYHNDFDNGASTSGIDSFYLTDSAGGLDIMVCFYSGKNMTGNVVGFRDSTGLMQAISLYTAGSMKWTTQDSC